jgi:trk system potassium uptake protein TrkA
LAEKSRFVVLGLGRFGGTLAERLAKLGHKVTGLDVSEEAVGRLEELLDEALVADATDRDVLAATELDKSQAVIIALGDEPLGNIITAMYVVELGAPKIIARGTDRVHARILEKLGQIDVVLPEQDMGAYVAEAIGGPLGPGTNEKPPTGESGADTP